MSIQQKNDFFKKIPIYSANVNILVSLSTYSPVLVIPAKFCQYLYVSKRVPMKTPMKNMHGGVLAESGSASTV